MTSTGLHQGEFFQEIKLKTAYIAPGISQSVNVLFCSTFPHYILTVTIFVSLEQSVATVFQSINKHFWKNTQAINDEDVTVLNEDDRFI